MWLPLLIALIAFSSPAQALTDEPVIYSRDTLLIVPKIEEVVAEKPQTPEPATTKDKPAEPAKKEPEPTPRKTKSVEVDIRPESYLAQEGMFTLQPFNGSGGLLIVYGASHFAALQPQHIYAKIDVLFIASNGTITQIMPQINPSELDQPVESKQSVTAMLMLQGGECEKQDIRPGDQVQNKLFKANPVILE